MNMDCLYARDTHSVLDTPLHGPGTHEDESMYVPEHLDFTWV